MFGILSSILFLSEYCLQIVVLFFQFIKLFLYFLHLGYGSLVDTSLHFRFKVDEFSFIVFEFKSSSVYSFFSVGYFASELFRPFCQ